MTANPSATSVRPNTCLRTSDDAQTSAALSPRSRAEGAGPRTRYARRRERGSRPDQASAPNCARTARDGTTAARRSIAIAAAESRPSARCIEQTRAPRLPGTTQRSIRRRADLRRQRDEIPAPWKRDLRARSHPSSRPPRVARLRWRPGVGSLTARDGGPSGAPPPRPPAVTIAGCRWAWNAVPRRKCLRRGCSRE